MAVSTRQVKNKRDSNGVLTGRPGTVYDVNIKYTAPDEKKKSYAKKGFATRREAIQHEAEVKTKLQNPGQIASITSQRKQTVARLPLPASLFHQELFRLHYLHFVPSRSR